MSYFKKLLLVLLLIFSFAFNSFSVLGYDEASNIYTVLDNENSNSLPNLFRKDASLNISGSAQFTAAQVENIINNIDSNKLYIVDLRQESHGLLNENIAFMFWNPNVDLNDGLSSSEVLRVESKEISKIPISSVMHIYNKKLDLLKTVKVQSVLSEKNLVTSKNINYIRFAVKDNYIPSDDIVDEFVDFVKSEGTSSHLHFHCEAGEGRTTTFMAMYQMMNNKDNLSLDEILQYQIKLGGISLIDIPIRKDFLNTFYNYTKANIDSNFEVPYSKWVERKVI
ncbi:fused DSP-PTPase phosphatase/NAD kinase-like protein [Clostridium ihumii]|uniref:fused DSP-PTPase phosphatase/NAD kinase-like protein n=1 Tax=Clostridium ihumii TaxID=1470356 RepID=UPI0006843127|nr:hypothetical protein [Clostridium ihumii]